MGGGKSSTSTQSVSIPPEVLARYNAVNARAETTAQQPFQQYGGEFVAPLTPTQTAGIQNTSAASQLAQPYYGAATGAALAGAMPVNPQGLQVGQYMNPFTEGVVGATQAAMGQQQGQQLAQQQAESIRAGAYGGDRAGLQRQALRGQQSLAQAQAIAPLYQQNYQQALQTAQQQQGVGLGAQQANRQAVQQLSQQLGGLGTGAQQAALQGAQAQIGAGTLQQQTQQAQDTAQYQQFLQQRGYDFQVAQFLANIAMGTGALSGSTTSTTQPRGFFSNRGGFKTGESLQRAGKAYGGGLDPNSMGGAVYEPGAFERGGYATAGSVVDATDLAAILAQQRQSFGPFASAGPYGQAAGATPHGPGGIVPQQQMHTPKLITAGALPKQQAGAGSDLGKVYSLANEATTGLTGKGLTERAGEKIGLRGGSNGPNDVDVKDSGQARNLTENEFKNLAKPSSSSAPETSVEPGLFDKAKGFFGFEHGGGVMPRHRYADGGSEDSQGDEAVPYDPSDVMGSKDPMEGVLKAGSQKHELLKPSGGGGGGGGGGGFGDVVNIASKVLPFFLKDGGVVPRQHHADGERAVSDFPIDAEIVERAPGLDPNVVSELKREEQRAPVIPQEAKGLVALRQQEEPQIDYRGMVESAAKQKGLRVDHATRLVQGESGFKPVVGDEGSSASLWQLHVGGLSDRYPNAGLGDDYFSQRRPELAKTFTPAQKIAYLNDPRNQGDITDFATDYISKNGAKPWTVARNQGLFGLSGQGGGAPRPPADVGRPAEGKAAEPGFFDRNKGIILPVLQGIGAMASSKSISPFAAALQGLGAGAKAYGEEETRQSDLDRVNAATPGIALDSARKAIFVDTNQATWINVNGKWVTKSDWRDMGSPSPTGSKMADYYLEKILPGQGGGPTTERKPQKPSSEIGAQTTESGAAPAPGKTAPSVPAVLPIDMTNPSMAQPRGVGSNIADQEARDIERIDYGPDRVRRTTANETALLDAKKAAQGARELKPSLNQLSLPLSNLAAGEQITPGALASLQTSLVKNVDAALDRVGLSQYKLAPQGLTDVQLADKAQALLTQARTLGLDQRAVSALDKVATSIANRDMTKEAAADILASAYTDNMRLQHESSYALKYSEGKSVPVAQRASEAYRAQYPDIDRQFNLEKMAIKDLLLTKTQTGEALVSYLVGQGKDKDLQKKITPDLIDKKYGVKISNYFLN